jgi:hypothetical protein
MLILLFNTIIELCATFSLNQLLRPSPSLDWILWVRWRLCCHTRARWPQYPHCHTHACRSDLDDPYVTKQGVLIDPMTLATDATKPQFIYFYNPECITYLGSGKFALVEGATHRSVSSQTKSTPP